MKIKLNEIFKTKIANKEVYTIGKYGNHFVFSDGVIEIGKQYENGFFLNEKQAKEEYLDKKLATVFSEEKKSKKKEVEELENDKD